ncbi:MAG TPA: acyltransferase [Burkholderiaceae bacterium]|jgi:peptidoglycan/LPS O-acetylase OafA/YrhL
MSSGHAAPARPRLDALQALRALAAGLVVFDHAAAGFLEHFHPGTEIPSAVWFAGALGVKVFFGISGYIIYLSTRSLAPGWAGASDFFRRRLIRVVPLYWMATLLYGLRLSLRGDAPGLGAWVMSLLFLPFSSGGAEMRPIVGVGWSLNFEMFFYAVLGLCLLLPRRASAWAALALLSGVLSLRLGGALGTAASTPGQLDFSLLADPILGFFMAGVLVAKAEPALRRWLGRRGPGFGIAAACSCGLPLALTAAVWFGAVSTPQADRWAPLVGIAALLCCALEQHGPAPAGSTLRRVLVGAGDASYSTYIVHTFALNALLWAALHLAGAGLGSWPVGAYAVAIAILGSGIGWLTFEAVERPTMRWLNARLLAPRRPAAMAPAGPT